MVMNLPDNAGDARDLGSIPGLGRSPGGGHGNPLVFLPGESHGQRILVGYSPQSRKELDMTERLHFHIYIRNRIASLFVSLLFIFYI